MRKCGSAAQWNWLVKLHMVSGGGVLWEPANQTYQQTRNDQEWEPKHHTSPMWTVDVIQHHIDRDMDVQPAAPAKKTKAVKTSVWKERCLKARDAALMEQREDPEKAGAQLDAEVALDDKAAPIKVDATDNVEERMRREAAFKAPREQSVSAEAKQRMLGEYSALAERCEKVDIFHRPISADYGLSASDVARLKREVQDAEAYAVQSALNDQAEIDEIVDPPAIEPVADPVVDPVVAQVGDPVVIDQVAEPVAEPVVDQPIITPVATPVIIADGDAETERQEKFAQRQIWMPLIEAA
jgi:hypothetical protein